MYCCKTAEIVLNSYSLNGKRRSKMKFINSQIKKRAIIYSSRENSANLAERSK